MAVTDNRVAAELINEMDDEEVACRGEQHRWPLLKPRMRTLPRGMRPIPQRDGCIQMVENCLNGCGRQRVTVLLPGAAYDSKAQRTYRSTKRWTVIPRDLGVSKTDIRTELYRRNAELILRTVDIMETHAGGYAKDED